MKKDGINPLKEYNIPRRIKATSQIPTYTQVSKMEGREHKYNELRKSPFLSMESRICLKKAHERMGDQPKTYSLNHSYIKLPQRRKKEKIFF